MVGACAATESGPVAGFEGSWTISQQGLVAQQPGRLSSHAKNELNFVCESCVLQASPGRFCY